MNSFDYYKYKNLEACNTYFTQSDLFAENKIRRWYATNFNTTLEDTYKLCWDHILTHFYESQLETLERSKVLELTKEQLPDIISDMEKESEDFIKELEKEQAESLANPPVRNGRSTQSLK
jgi:hypothetical protein